MFLKHIEIDFQVAVCVPDPCTFQQSVTGIGEWLGDEEVGEGVAIFSTKITVIARLSKSLQGPSFLTR